MELKFTKMHGCGNDYIYINCFETVLDNPNEVAANLSRRHFSVGSDGLIMICPSEIADAKMRMFNADGSEGRMCGNALRCVGKFLYDKGIEKKELITVETLSGIKTLKMHVKDGLAVAATADVGKAVFEKEAVPVIWDAEGTVAVPLYIVDREFVCTAVSVGSAHNVCFVEDVAAFDLDKYGPATENHAVFPDRVNAEFIKVKDPHSIDMRVWERGSGETWACGTGACAAVAAACINGFCPYGEDVTVNLKGGKLVINVTKERVLMTGPAVTVCEGVAVL